MGWFKKIVGIAAPIVGGIFGGPAGAAIGAKLGGMVAGEKGEQYGGAIASGISGIASAYGVHQQQEQQAQYVQQTQAFNAQEAQAGRDFNASQAALNRDFQERMSNTQYQRAMGDMQGAGLNPMLAFSQGGAGNLSGSAASGPAASSGAVAQAMDKVAPILNTAARVQEIHNLKSQGDLIEAQAGYTRAGIFERMSNTESINVGIHEVKNRTAKLEHEIRTAAEETKNARHRGELFDLDKSLKRLEAQYKRGEITGQAWVNHLRETEARIRQFQSTGEMEESIFWSDPEQVQRALKLKHITGPMVGQISSGLNSAANISRSIVRR